MSNAAIKNEKTGNFRVKGRLLWNHLTAPRRGQKNDAGEPVVGKYEVSLAIPKGTDLKALQAEVLEVAKAKFPAQFKAANGKWPSGIASPFKKTAANDKLAEIADDFPDYIDARDKDRPGLVWPNGKKLMQIGDVEREPESADIYSGRFAAVAFDVYAYDKKKKGVSFGLKAVQLLEDADELVIGGGRVSAESEFEGVGETSGDGAGSMFE